MAFFLPPTANDSLKLIPFRLFTLPPMSKPGPPVAVAVLAAPLEVTVASGVATGGNLSGVVAVDDA